MMIRGTGKIMLGTVLLLVASGPVCLAQQELRWKFRPGEQLKVSVEQKTVSNTRVADQSLKMTVQLTVEEKWEVKEVAENGVATIDRSLTLIKLSIRSGVDEEITFDSSQQRSAPGAARTIAKVLAPVLGKSVRIQVNPRGAVVDVELGSELKGQLVELAKVLGDFFSPDSIEQQLMTIGRLPAGPVSKGQSWMANVESTTQLGKLSVARTFTYEGEKNTTDGSVSEIAIAGQLTLVPGTGKKDRKVTLREQQLTGVLRFDAAAGRLLESSEQQILGIHTAYRELRIQSEVKTSTRTTVTLVGP